MSKQEKASVLAMFEAGDIDEREAREQLGDEDFERAIKRAEDTDDALSGDTSQYILGE